MVPAVVVLDASALVFMIADAAGRRRLREICQALLDLRMTRGAWDAAYEELHHRIAHNELSEISSSRAQFDVQYETRDEAGARARGEIEILDHRAGTDTLRFLQERFALLDPSSVCLASRDDLLRQNARSQGFLVWNPADGPLTAA